jgi:hypothetical protein
MRTYSTNSTALELDQTYILTSTTSIQAGWQSIAETDGHIFFINTFLTRASTAALGFSSSDHLVHQSLLRDSYTLPGAPAYAWGEYGQASGAAALI